MNPPFLCSLKTGLPRRQFLRHLGAGAAAQIGKAAGDKLTVKTAADEFSAPLTELHDVWWNSIARAMA